MEYISRYRMVEYSQNWFGSILSRLLPEGFKLTFREGEPITYVAKDSRTEAEEQMFRRINQLRMSGHRDDVCLDIEEIKEKRVI